VEAVAAARSSPAGRVQHRGRSSPGRGVQRQPGHEAVELRQPAAGGIPHTGLDVSVVVCNASRLAASHCEDLDDALLDFRVHVSGHAALLASVAGSLKRLRGSVVAVGDLQTQQPNRDHVWYLVAKAGLETLVRTLAIEWAPHVRCNVVAPGAMDWHEGWTDEARRDAIMDSIPQQRIGSFDELAGCITWLALDASYVNGQVLKMDGGRSVWLK
jgi:pteridine reductase